MTSKYDPFVDACLFAFSDPHCNIHVIELPPNHSMKKLQERAKFRKYNWRFARDEERVVVQKRYLVKPKMEYNESNEDNN